MPIEEVFDLIKKAINNKPIKYFEDKIKEIKNFQAFITKNKLISLEKQSTWARKSLDMENVFETGKFKELAIDFERRIAEYEEKCAMCRDVKSYFGKNQIVKKVINFSDFLILLNMINVDIDYVIDEKMFARIIGLAIYNNNRIYEKSSKALNKDLNSESILIRRETEIIRALKPYFNASGNIIANEHVSFFVNKLYDLFEPYFDEEKDKEVIECQEYDPVSVIFLMKRQLFDANSKVVSQKQKEVISKNQLRLNEQELAKYYDGEKILIPCESLEEFKKLVYSCYLSDEQSARIISKMETFMSKEDNKILFLTLEEQKIYKLAIEKQLGNIRIKNIIEEINMLLEMYPSSSSEDKEYIEEEIKSLISNLRYILKVNPAELKLSY